MEVRVIERDDCVSFVNDSLINDFMIIIGDKQISVNKSVLISESDYFKAIFDSQWIESNTNSIKLQQTLYKPFLTVLKFVYGLHLDHQQWNQLKIQQINESIIISNKYQFNRVEKMMSNMIIDRLPMISETDQSLQTILDMLEMSKINNLLHLTNACLNYIDENADKILQVIDKHFIMPEMILQIISRDEFGVKEIDLFNAIINWITRSRQNFGNKFYAYEQILLQSIRFGSISDKDMESHVKPTLSEVLSDRIFKIISEYILRGNSNKSNRVCVQSETCYSAKLKEVKSSDGPLYLSLLPPTAQQLELFYGLETMEILGPCFKYTFDLQLMTKINFVEFRIIPYRTSVFGLDRILMDYVIEVRDTDLNGEEKWQQVVTLHKYDFIGLQQIYFGEVLTNGIRIAHLMSSELLFEIPSISYKYTKDPQKLFHNIIQPLNDITAIEGTKCLLIIGGKEELITNYILKDNDKESIKDSSTLLHRMENLNQSDDYETYYYVKFSQPFVIDSFQFDLMLGNDGPSSFQAVIEIFILNGCSSDQTINFRHWVKVSEGLVEDCVSCNVEFDLQAVSVIKICGFRFRKNDRDFRIPLHISRVRVPIDHFSDQWLNGKTLSIPSNDESIASEMLSCFRSPVQSNQLYLSLVLDD